MKKEITIKVNGAEHTLEVEPRLLLVHLIRENLNLTGTHIGDIHYEYCILGTNQDLCKH